MKQFSTKVLIGTGSIALVLGLEVLQSIGRSHRGVVEQEWVNKIEVGLRTPAGVPSHWELRPADHNETAFLILIKCETNITTFLTKQPRVRIIIESCPSETPFKITNQATGFSVLLFKLDDRIVKNHSEKRFSTDYIDLVEGDNLITLNYNRYDLKVKRAQKITIRRTIDLGS